jgi:predicted Zn-dependent peptidase
MGWDEYRRYAPSIEKITAADVQRVARRVLDPRRAITAIVRPEEVAGKSQKQKAAARAARKS